LVGFDIIDAHVKVGTIGLDVCIVTIRAFPVTKAGKVSRIARVTGGGFAYFAGIRFVATSTCLAFEFSSKDGFTVNACSTMGCT
jgi:hypothetical protein